MPTTNHDMTKFKPALCSAILTGEDTSQLLNHSLEESPYVGADLLAQEFIQYANGAETVIKILNFSQGVFYRVEGGLISFLPEGIDYFKEKRISEKAIALVRYAMSARLLYNKGRNGGGHYWVTSIDQPSPTAKPRAPKASSSTKAREVMSKASTLVRNTLFSKPRNSETKPTKRWSDDHLSVSEHTNNRNNENLLIALCIKEGIHPYRATALSPEAFFLACVAGNQLYAEWVWQLRPRLSNHLTYTPGPNAQKLDSFGLKENGLSILKTHLKRRFTDPTKQKGKEGELIELLANGTLTSKKAAVLFEHDHMTKWLATICPSETVENQDGLAENTDDFVLIDNPTPQAN